MRDVTPLVLTQLSRDILIMNVMKQRESKTTKKRVPERDLTHARTSDKGKAGGSRRVSVGGHIGNVNHQTATEPTSDHHK